MKISKIKQYIISLQKVTQDDENEDNNPKTTDKIDY